MTTVSGCLGRGDALMAAEMACISWYVFSTSKSGLGKSRACTRSWACLLLLPTPECGAACTAAPRSTAENPRIAVRRVVGPEFCTQGPVAVQEASAVAILVGVPCSHDAGMSD